MGKIGIEGSIPKKKWKIRIILKEGSMNKVGVIRIIFYKLCSLKGNFLIMRRVGLVDSDLCLLRVIDKDIIDKM